MGMHSWRCAKTTKGIPIQRYQLTEVVAFLPDGKRVSGFLSDYGELLCAEYVDSNSQPLPEDQNFPEYSTRSLLGLYAQAMDPPVNYSEAGGTYTVDDLDRIAEAIRIVRADEVTPSDTFDALAGSEPDPWKGHEYDLDAQWKLPLAEALALNPSPEDDPMTGFHPA